MRAAVGASGRRGRPAVATPISANEPESSAATAAIAIRHSPDTDTSPGPRRIRRNQAEIGAYETERRPTTEAEAGGRGPSARGRRAPFRYEEIFEVAWMREAASELGSRGGTTGSGGPLCTGAECRVPLPLAA